MRSFNLNSTFETLGGGVQNTRKLYTAANNSQFVEIKNRNNYPSKGSNSFHVWFSKKTNMAKGTH